MEGIIQVNVGAATPLAGAWESYLGTNPADRPNFQEAYKAAKQPKGNGGTAAGTTEDNAALSSGLTRHSPKGISS